MDHSGGDKLPGANLFTHCHRELFHKQWKDLLDDEFLEAYEHGMPFMCGDGIKRRLFPRIFTYSADYPEKYVARISFSSSLSHLTYRVLIATIRNLGGCPCPRCLIPKEDLQNVASEDDMFQREALSRHDTADRRAKICAARKVIYEQHLVVNTPQVEVLLKPESLVPTVVRTLRFGDRVDHIPSSSRTRFRQD